MPPETFATNSNLSADHYDRMRDAVEMPNDARPTSDDAIRARQRAIADGRLQSIPRDEWKGETKPDHMDVNELPAAAPAAILAEPATVTPASSASTPAAEPPTPAAETLPETPPIDPV